jgi:hypothetical protein
LAENQEKPGKPMLYQVFGIKNKEKHGKPQVL